MSMFRTRWREAGCPIDLIPVLCLQHQGESWKWNNNHEMKKMFISCEVPSWAHGTNTVDSTSRWKQMILVYAYRSWSWKCSAISYLFTCWDFYFFPLNLTKNLYFSHPHIFLPSLCVQLYLESGSSIKAS